MARNTWKTVEIGSLCQGIFDGPHATPEKTSSGPVFLGISNLNAGHLDLTETEHLSEEDFKKWTRRVTPRPNDLVFSYETRLGEAAVIPSGFRCCLGRRMALMRPDAQRVEARFLLYAFLGPEFQNTIRSRTIPGSTVDRIPLIEFPQFPIRVPNLPEQRAIAQILGALDDKIELNRRMNETLEAMARAIFKSWFTDFDPVKRNQAPKGGETVQSSEALAKVDALFPDSFEHSPLGRIPKGWRVGKLDELLEILGGGTPKTSVLEFWDGETPWYSVGDAPRPSDLFVIDTERKITKAGLESCSTRLLPKNTTIISARGTVGRLAMAGIPLSMNQSCYAVRPQGSRGEYFTYYLLRAKIDELSQSTHGTVFDTITRGTFTIIDTVIPPDPLTRKFDERVAPLLGRILSGVKECRALAAVRDALLPKLISGELRTCAADGVVGTR